MVNSSTKSPGGHECSNKDLYTGRGRCYSPGACADFGYCRDRGYVSSATRVHERVAAVEQRRTALEFKHAIPYQQCNKWRHAICRDIVMNEHYPND